jgi:uncharacterized protein (TIGR02996 family)
MPSSELLALWAAIRASPHDDTPRLAYADWLGENGDPDRAEFIRVQCALAALGTDRRKGRKERPALEAREKKLLSRHQAAWGQRFCEAVGRHGVRFVRGFADPVGLSLAAAAWVAEAGDELEPLNELRVRQGLHERYNHAHLKRIAGWVGAGCVVLLNLHGGGRAVVDAIVRPGHTRSLRSLILYRCKLSDSSAGQLAAWTHAATLRLLNLSHNPITDAGAFALADSPHLTDIDRLDLTHTRIGPDGRRRLRERFGDRVSIEA